MKRLWLLFTMAVLCMAQSVSVLTVIPDLTMTGSPVPLTNTTSLSRYVHWCQFTAPAGNAATIAWGNSAVTLSAGSTIDPGGRQSIPSSGPVYDLSTVYFIGTSGDKVKATCQMY